MDDIGLQMPPGPALDIDPKAVRLGLRAAGGLRQFTLGLARVAIEKNPGNKVPILMSATIDVAYKSNDVANGIAVSGSSVACGKGCGWCCHRNVETSIMESIVIAVKTSWRGDPRGAAFDAAAKAIVELDPVDQARSRAACPFLGADSICTIHDIRPFACRSLYASDARICKSGLEAARRGDIDAVMACAPGPFLAGCAHRAGLNGLAKDLGLQHDTVDLIATVAAIRKNPNIMERWAAGEHVFAPRVDPGPVPRVRSPS